MPYAFASFVSTYVPGVKGNTNNVTQNQTNSGPGGSVLYPQGSNPGPGGTGSGLDAGGSGVVGGLNPPYSTDPSAIGGSGPNVSQTCMTIHMGNTSVDNPDVTNTNGCSDALCTVCQNGGGGGTGAGDLNFGSNQGFGGGLGGIGQGLGLGQGLGVGGGLGLAGGSGLTTYNFSTMLNNYNAALQTNPFAAGIAGDVFLGGMGPGTVSGLYVPS